MWEDPIVAEVRRVREEFAARFNYDIKAIVEDVRRRQAALGDRLVPQPPRRLPAKRNDVATQEETTARD